MILKIKVFRSKNFYDVFCAETYLETKEKFHYSIASESVRIVMYETFSNLIASFFGGNKLIFNLLIP